MLPRVAEYVSAREAETDQIGETRRAELDRFARRLADRAGAGEPLRMTFVCTHNSRRSQMSQLWAAVAAEAVGVARVTTFSGGTESTAFNPRAVAAMRRAGFAIEPPAASGNPSYCVSWSDADGGVRCFSKRYDDVTNPAEGFVAVMVCGDADEACPNVAGADLRVAITYEDPKVADDTPGEAAKYDERCAQIAREMLYLFGRVAEAVSLSG